MKRLSLFLLILLYSIDAFAQHTHSRGGNSFYWAFVGAVGAGICYIVFLTISFLPTLFKRKKKLLKTEAEIKAINTEVNTVESDVKKESVAILKKTNYRDSDNTKNNFHRSGNIANVWKNKRTLIAVVLYLFLLLSSVLLVNNHIDNKRIKLYRDLFGRILNAFDGYRAEALNKDIEEYFLEYKEVPIPPFPVDGSKIDRYHWDNMFSGIEHLYKIKGGNWVMSGIQFQPICDNSGVCITEGIEIYKYMPYMICVPQGFDFNTQIARAILNKSLEKVYCEPEQFDKRYELTYTREENENKYYKIQGRLYLRDSVLMERNSHHYSEATGNEPIYEDGRFMGFWYGMDFINHYRVLYRCVEESYWIVEEKREASVKDRFLLYGGAFLILSCLLSLFLLREKRKNKLQS